MLNTSVTDTVHNAKQQLAAMIASTTQDNDRIRRAQMNPVLGGVVIEGEQLVEIVGDLRDRFGKLGPIGRREPAHGVEGMSFVLGIPDLRERLFRPRMRAVGQRPEHVRDLVELMPTSA
jgi:hypothetical protein